MTRGKHAAPKVRTGRVRWGLLGMVFGLMLATSAPVMAEINEVTPSTNDTNRENGWAHFNVIDLRIGEVDVEFVSTRTFASCFEYRLDEGDPTGADNFNADITDGLWESVCVNNSTAQRTLTADALVEIRMVFGAERDERFDWTPIAIPAPLAADDCKAGGHEGEGFSNQGQCVASVKANENADFESNPPPRGRSDEAPGRSGDAPGRNK
jgi:hypothetical protein